MTSLSLSPSSVGEWAAELERKEELRQRRERRKQRQLGSLSTWGQGGDGAWGGDGSDALGFGDFGRDRSRRARKQVRARRLQIAVIGSTARGMNTLKCTTHGCRALSVPQSSFSLFAPRAMEPIR